MGGEYNVATQARARREGALPQLDERVGEERLDALERLACVEGQLAQDAKARRSYGSPPASATSVPR